MKTVKDSHLMCRAFLCSDMYSKYSN